MKKELFNEIEIPDGVEVKIDGTSVEVKGAEGEIKKDFKVVGLTMKVDGKKVIIGHKKSTKKEKKLMNTLTAHIKNMIAGVQEKFEYKLKVCHSHFPITVDVKGDEAIVKNFLGEKIPRKVKIPKGIEVSVAGQEITVKGVDKEVTGQAAANFEKATKIPLKDRRIFQDGIFIINKAGKEI